MEPKPYSLACLYTGENPKLDFDAILSAIAQDPHLSYFSPSIVTRLPAKLVSFDFNGQFTVQIVIDNLPVDAQTFAIALMGAKATTIKNDFAQIVEKHRGHITVTCIPEVGAYEDLERRLIRIYALQMVTEALYKFAKPKLIYSSMGESLVRPSLNPRSYRGLLDSRIFEQAVLFSRKGQVVAGKSMGANVWGAEDLIGKPVVFTQVDFPSWVLTKGSTRFFEYCDEEGVPEEDEIFTDDQKFESYSLKHTQPTANHPFGKIEITIDSNFRADELRPDGRPMFPELLSKDNEILKAQGAATQSKRKVERGKLFKLGLLLLAIAFTLAVATIASSR